MTSEEAAVHTFPFSWTWAGSTADPVWSPDAEIDAPGKPSLPVSAGITSMRGDPGRYNPEDLLGASLATCHLLTFLGLARRDGVDVRAVDGFGEVVVDRAPGGPRVTQIRLAPTVRVAPGSDVEAVVALFRLAHRYCWIARALACEVALDPQVVVDVP